VVPARRHKQHITRLLGAAGHVGAAHSIRVVMGTRQERHKVWAVWCL
jgi:hypothetical protein